MSIAPMSMQLSPGFVSLAESLGPCLCKEQNVCMYWVGQKFICIFPYHLIEKIELFGQPNGSDGKESAYDARDMAVIPG